MEQKDTSQISAFDTLFSNNHIQMLKVLLPYMDNQFQKNILPFTSNFRSCKLPSTLCGSVLIPCVAV